MNDMSFQKRDPIQAFDAEFGTKVADELDQAKVRYEMRQSLKGPKKPFWKPLWNMLMMPVLAPVRAAQWVSRSIKSGLSALSFKKKVVAPVMPVPVMEETFVVPTMKPIPEFKWASTEDVLKAEEAVIKKRTAKHKKRERKPTKPIVFLPVASTVVKPAPLAGVLPESILPTSNLQASAIVELAADEIRGAPAAKKPARKRTAAKQKIVDEVPAQKPVQAVPPVKADRPLDENAQRFIANLEADKQVAARIVAINPIEALTQALQDAAVAMRAPERSAVEVFAPVAQPIKPATPAMPVAVAKKTVTKPTVIRDKTPRYAEAFKLSTKPRKAPVQHEQVSPVIQQAKQEQSKEARLIAEESERILLEGALEAAKERTKHQVAHDKQTASALALNLPANASEDIIGWALNYGGYDEGYLERCKQNEVNILKQRLRDEMRQHPIQTLSM